MVGVPGKSKGCHTCRRRKIKCDQGKPTCARCIKSGRECEGYARGPVFLNRTAKGLEKRRHLDEARPRLAELSRSEVLDEVEAIRQFAIFGNPSATNQWHAYYFNHTSLTLAMENSNCLPDLVEGFFLETYLPFSSDGTPITGEWLHQTFKIVDRGEPLNKSLSALAITRIGRQKTDFAMVTYGRTLYGQALRAVQRALWDRDQAVDDQILAACQALKMFELQEATQDGISSFDSHVQGLIRLLVFRGPERNTTLLAKAITHDVRYSGMINAIQYRKRSPMGNPEWRVQTWGTCTDVEQSLWDKGYDLAGVAEDLDSLAESFGQATTASLTESCFQRAVSIGDDMLKWHGWMLQCCSLAVEWSDPLVASDQPAQPRLLLGENLISFAKLRQSFLMLDYWALRITQSILVLALKRMIPPDAPYATSAVVCTSERQIQLVKNIVRIAPYCARDEHGINSSARCIMPLRVALFVGRMSQLQEAKDLKNRCESLLQEISNRKGMKHAHEISRRSGRWEDTFQPEDLGDPGREDVYRPVQGPPPGLYYQG